MYSIWGCAALLIQLQSLILGWINILTWHLIGWICCLSGLRSGKSRAIAEPWLEGWLGLCQPSFCLYAWQHHSQICSSRSREWTCQSNWIDTKGSFTWIAYSIINTRLYYHHHTLNKQHIHVIHHHVSEGKGPTIGGEAVGWSGLRVGRVNCRLLHASELWLARVGRHGRSHGSRQDVGVRPANQTQNQNIQLSFD